jgi:tetratricopeptide (TPR) repeat protein
MSGGAGFLWWKGDFIPSMTSAPSNPEKSGGATGQGTTVEEALAARFSQALELSRSGRSGEAAALFQSILEQYPHIPEPYNNLAVLSAAEGDLDASQRLLEEALRANPSYATILENLNTIQLEKALGGEIRGEKSTPRLQMISNISEAPPQTHQTPPTNTPAVPPPQPASTQPAPAPVQPETASQEISSFLSDWAASWSGKDFPRYIAFYGEGFKPSGSQSRSAWKYHRARLD